MAINYVIGIGGTGARVIEALVHCCAAGLGPDRLNIFLIDPDEGNGNLSRTKDLISAYQDCHRIYREHSASPQQLFKTEIRTQDLTWGILEKQNARLDDYIHYDSLPEDLQGLVTLLFSPDELSRELNEGFRGHPSIGAAVMANAEEKGPWQTFWQDVNNAQGEGSVRAFLIGSVFGGTGAAGIPTFGSPQVLKLREKKAKLNETGASKIRLGAALVLPYFLFEMNSEATARAETELCVTPADFPIATKVALEYYDTKPLAFDDIYLIGDDSERKVGEFSPGAKSQDNRPHYVELVTALAAFDFLRTNDAPSREPLYFVAGRDSDVVDWSALPVSRDEDKLVELQNTVKHALVTMSVFSYGFATYGVANFVAKPSSVLHTWYLSRFSNQPNAKGKAYIDEATIRDLNVVAEYGQTFLKWFAQLDGEDGRLALVRGDRLGVDLSGKSPSFVGHRDAQDSRIPVLLKAGPNAAGDGDVTSRTSRSDDLASALSKEGGDDPSASSAARYIDLFYRAASRFTDTEFHISTAEKGA